MIAFEPRTPNTTPHRIEDGPIQYEYLMWKGKPQYGYVISSDGVVYEAQSRFEIPHRKIKYRNYARVQINGTYGEYRVDYMVAYTFLGFYDDAIRLFHKNDLSDDDRLSNLQWVRKSELMKKYMDMAIIEPDGTIKEQWKPCKTVYNPNLGYEISNLGRVRNKYGKFIDLHTDSGGYLVFYYLDAFNKTTRIQMVHTAVAEAFIPNPDPEKYTLVNHLDGNKANPIVSNLEWTDKSGNGDHAYMHGLSIRHGSDEDAVVKVCELLQEGKLSNVEIAKLTGINVKTVSDIYRGRRWKDISQNYNFHGKKWTPAIKEQVTTMIRRGYKGRQIAGIMELEYDQPFISLYERIRRDLKARNEID